MRDEFVVSERRACAVMGQHRSTRRTVRCAPDNAAALMASVIDLARQYGRDGYRRLTALLRAESWRCNHKRVERIRRRERLKVPSQQRKRGRLWLTTAPAYGCGPSGRTRYGPSAPQLPV